MKTLKFDEHDRKKVISEIESHFGVELSRVGSFRKFLEDSSGKSYWVFGGYEDWHGIRRDMLDEERRRSTSGALVIAKRHRTSIDVFVGPLQPLVDNSDNLHETQTGDHQFNIVIRGNIMTIKEVPGLSLSKLGAAKEVGPPVNPVVDKLEAMLAKLSPKDRRELLEKLGRDGKV